MIPLFNLDELKQAKVTDLFMCKCEYCNKSFYTTKRQIMYALRNKRNSAKYCSMNCLRKHQISNRVHTNCANCNKPIIKLNYIVKNSISKKVFCSRSCSVTYKNTHKTTGNRRSKLEIYLEDKLKLLYPNLEILFNNKTTINSELDIYMPSIKLAFELNGIFHYEPIYGQDKLCQIQNNDQRKFQACLEHGIELCIIDTSKFINFKERKANEYLDIITNVINSKYHN